MGQKFGVKVSKVSFKTTLKSSDQRAQKRLTEIVHVPKQFNKNGPIINLLYSPPVLTDIIN